MQNTMLDSTISQIPQDDSSVEYVAPEKNPIALPPETVIKGSLITEKAVSDARGKPVWI